MKSSNSNTVSIALLTAVLLCVTGAANASTPVYAGYPAPGGTTASGSGSGVSQAGGKTWSYSGFNPTAYDELFYTIGSTVNGIFNLGSPILSANGTNNTLSFNSAQSSLNAGIAVWTGSTSVPLTTGGAQQLSTEFKLTVTDAFNTPLSLSAPTSFGLPSTAGAVLKVVGNFKATWAFLASTDGVHFSAALPLYNSLSYKFPNGNIISNVGGAFYATAPVPEPETYAMLLAGLGLMSVIARRKGKQI